MNVLIGLLIGTALYLVFGKNMKLPSAQGTSAQNTVDPKYFVVKPDGLVYFNNISSVVVRQLLQSTAVAPIEGDPRHVELIPYTYGQAVTANAWAETLRKQNLYILVSRWAHVPVSQPRYARAVNAYGVASFATPSGDYALLEPEPLAMSTASAPLSSPQNTSSSPQNTSSSPQNTSSSPQNTSSSPQTSDPWTGLPPEIAADVKSAYTQATDAATLEKAAKELDRLGYPSAANEYRAKAQKLKATQSFRTFELRDGDNPSHLAKHFTDDASRWKELLQTNPNLSVVTIEGRSFVQPWKPKQKIVFPADWDMSRGAPPKLSAPRVPPTGGL